MATVKKKLKELETILKDSNDAMKKSAHEEALKRYMYLLCFLTGVLTTAIGYLIFICV